MVRHARNLLATEQMAPGVGQQRAMLPQHVGVKRADAHAHDVGLIAVPGEEAAAVAAKGAVAVRRCAVALQCPVARVDERRARDAVHAEDERARLLAALRALAGG